VAKLIRLYINIWRSAYDFLEVGTKIEMHETACRAKAKFKVSIWTYRQNYGQFLFSIVPVGTLGLISPVREGANFFFGGIGKSDSAV